MSFSLNSIFAQDEIYSTSKKNNSEINIEDSVNLEVGSEYYTEEDYVEEDNYRSNDHEQIMYNDEEWEKEEKDKERKRRKRRNSEFAAEVLVDVFIQTAFFVATFWLQ